MSAPTSNTGLPVGTNLSNASAAASQFDRLQQLAQLKRQNDELWHNLDDDGKLVFMADQGNLEALADSVKTMFDDDLDVIQRVTKEQTDILNDLATKDKLTKGAEYTQGKLPVEDLRNAFEAFDQDFRDTLLKSAGLAGETQVVKSDRYLPPDGSTIQAFFNEAVGPHGGDGYPMAKVNDVLSKHLETRRQLSGLEETIRSQNAVIERLGRDHDLAINKSNRVAAQATGDRESLASRFKSLEAETANLRERERQTQQTLSEQGILKVNYQLLEGKNGELNDELVKLNNELSQVRSDLDFLRKSSSKTAADVATLTEQNSALQQQLDAAVLQSDAYMLAHELETESRNELKGSIDAAWADRIQELETSRGRLEGEVSDLRSSVSAANQSWLQALTVVLRADMTGEDLTPEVLHPLLQQTDPLFASLDALQSSVATSCRFADGGFIGVEQQLTRASMSTTELLALSCGIQGGTPFASDLALLAWMEDSLLGPVLSREKGGSWVLLSFKLLMTMTKTSSSVARGLAYVQLANLAQAYRPVQDGWSELVHDIIVNHPSLKTDILGQACLVRLVMTTGNDKLDDPLALISTMADCSFDVIVKAVDHNTPVADIMRMLPSTAEFFASELELVVFRLDDEEAVLAKTAQNWVCSVQQLGLEYVEGDEFRVVWGDAGKGQYVTLRRGSGAQNAFQTYMTWNHGVTLRTLRTKAKKRTVEAGMADLSALPDIFARSA